MKPIYESKKFKYFLFIFGIFSCFVSFLFSWYSIIKSVWPMIILVIPMFGVGAYAIYDSFQPRRIIRWVIETDDDCRKIYGVDLRTLRAMEEFWSL